jgi:hypothetical protein
MNKPTSSYTYAVRVFIPDAPENSIADVIAEFATLFACVSTYDTTRMWLAGSGKLVSTPVTIIEGTDPHHAQVGPAVYILAQRLKAELGHEVVYQHSTIESVIV